MGLKVSHGYVYRCKVISETTWKLGWTKLMSKENKSFLKTSRTVSAVRDNHAGMRGEMSDFEEWWQSVRMFSNKVKEVQSKFSEFDCRNAGLESRLESQSSSPRSTSCRGSPAPSADESVMILDEYSSTFQLHLAWPQLWGLGPWDLRIVRATVCSSASLLRPRPPWSWARRVGGWALTGDVASHPRRGSDVVISVYICECGVSPWEVKLGTRWPILGLGRDYLLLGSALWNLRWKCSCLSRNENKEFIFVSVKVVTKMPCDRIRGWSKLIKSEFCSDKRKIVKCSVVITSCRTGIKDLHCLCQPS